MDAWSALGIGTEMRVIPRARQNDREYRAAFTGAETHSYAPGSTGMLSNWRLDQIPTAENRWQGGNRGVYVNPLLHQMALDHDTTLDRAHREDLLARIYQTVSEEIPTFPFYYTVRIYVVRSGLEGIQSADLGQGGGPLASVHQLSWAR
jgi:ABC-type transport system substrate-binding protein